MKKLTEVQRKLLRNIAIKFAFGHSYKYEAREYKSIEILRGMGYITTQKARYWNKEGEAEIDMRTMMTDDQLNEVVQSVRQRVKDIKENRRLDELKRWEDTLYIMDKYRVVDNANVWEISTSIDKEDRDIWENMYHKNISRALIYSKLKQLS